MAAEALKILSDSNTGKGMEADLAEIRKKLGESGAAGRVARLALNLAGAATVRP